MKKIELSDEAAGFFSRCRVYDSRNFAFRELYTVCKKAMRPPFPSKRAIDAELMLDGEPCCPDAEEILNYLDYAKGITE